MSKTKSWRRRLAIGAVAVAGAVLLWAIVGAYALPALARPRAERVLSAALGGRAVRIAGVAFHPFTLQLRVSGLDVADREPGRTLLSVRELLVDVQLSSLWYRGLVAREVRVDGPSLRLARTGPGAYSVSDLLAPAPRQDAAAEGGGGARFSLNNIRLGGGRIEFEDRPLGRTHVVDAIAVDVPFLSNLPLHLETFVTPAVGATVNGTPFALKGRTRPFHGSLETVFELKVDDLDAPKYLDYLPQRPAAAVDAARLDVDGTLSFTRNAAGEPALLVAGRAALRGLATRDAAGRPLFAARRLDLDLAQLDVFRRVLEVRRIALDGPELNVIRTAAATNVADLAPRGPEPVPATGVDPRGPGVAPGEPRPEAGDRSSDWRVSIDEIRLDGGKVAVADLAVRPAFELVLDPVVASLRDWRLADGAPSPTLTLEARAASGEVLTHEGPFDPRPPLAFAGRTGLAGLRAAALRPYVRDLLPFDLARGTLGFEGACTGALLEPATIACRDARIIAADVRLGVKDGPADRVVVRRGEADVDELSLATASLRVARLALDGARVDATRTAEGIDVVAMFLPPAIPGAAGSETAREVSSPGWTVDLGVLACRGCAVLLHDLDWPQPVELALEPLTLDARGLSTRPGTRGSVDAKAVFGGGGSVTLKGRLTLTPFELDAATAVSGADLVRLQGYLAPFVRLVLADGELTGKGRLTLRLPDDGDLVLRYEGDANFVNVVTTDADHDEELFAWSSLYFDKLRLGYNPFVLEAASIAATDARGRLSIDPDGSINLYGVSDALRPAPEDGSAPPTPPPSPSPSDAAAAGASAGLPVTIDAVTVLNGELLFVDRSVDPPFEMPFTELNGSIRGLSSDSAATVELRGRLGAHAPVEITGRMNPLSPSLYADMKIASRDVDLSPWTPYSGRWLGWAIAGGTLSTEMTYVVDQRLLDAKHRVVIDQLTFGERVPSKDRIRVPIKTAVALLKDRNGRIDLDVPVSGSIDDPQFRVWPIVWKMVRNVFSRAGSAPFSMFKGVGGGAGDELSFVEFAPGRAALDETATARLAALAANLAERPALTLLVTGFADPERDREGLKRLILERKVKARKAADLDLAGEDAGPAALDALPLTPEEYPRYLEKAYRKEKIPKPRTALGLVKDLPPGEMEQLILTSIVVADDDLRRLAAERAGAARERLVANGVDAARLTVVEPKDGTAPAPGKGTSRALVEFAIPSADPED